MDVKIAFSSWCFEQKNYMQPPLGVDAPSRYLCRLRPDLHGLKQAPRAWFEHFVSVIQAAMFHLALMIMFYLFTPLQVVILCFSYMLMAC
jgi:hypothetical protein